VERLYGTTRMCASSLLGVGFASGLTFFGFVDPQDDLFADRIPPFDVPPVITADRQSARSSVDCRRPGELASVRGMGVTSACRGAPAEIVQRRRNVDQCHGRTHAADCCTISA
jgi:hypothetical protein